MAFWLTGFREPDLLRPDLATMLGREEAAGELEQKVERAVWALQVLQRELGRDRDVKLAAPARRELESFLSAGLERRVGERRVGEPLTSTEPPPGWHAVSGSEPGPLDIFRALREGGIEPPAGLNVCNECTVVFRSRRERAKKCGRCHRSPRPRPELKPWHAAACAQGTFNPVTGEPAGWTLAYVGDCRVCGERFSSGDKRTHHCPSCGSGSVRLSRHRARSR